MRIGPAIAAAIAAAMAVGCGGSDRPTGGLSSTDGEPGLEVAVYTAGTTESEARARGFAMIIDRRRIELPQGVGEVTLGGVPGTIDPGSVWFRSFTDPDGTKVLEQSFAHDGADVARLVRGQLGKHIVIERSDGVISGTLAHVDRSRLILDVGDGKQVTIPFDDHLLGAQLSTGADLELRPTLTWKLDVAHGGEHLIELVYSAHRLTWWADYSLVIDDRGDGTGLAEITAWATLANDSDALLESARVKLVAGVDDRVAPGQPAVTPADAWVWPVEERVTLEPRSVRQLPLFPPRRGIETRHELRYEGMPAHMRGGGMRTDQYYGNTHQPQVDEELVFENAERLPGGRVYIYVRRTGEEDPVLSARSIVKATEPGTEARVALGVAKRVTGSRRQVGFNYDYQKGQINEAFEVTIKNDRDEKVRVRVVEELYRMDGGTQVVNMTPRPVVDDGKRLEFLVDVAPLGSTKVSYEVIYRGVNDTVNR